MAMSDAQHLTALIIIADEERRYSLDKPLRRAGFKIRDATNGEDGLRLAMEAPDLIVLDLHLPDMTGFEVCCRLKAHAATANIPVLHLSVAPVESSEFAHHLERGDEAYLTYPVEEVELLSFVNTLIRGRQAQRQFSSFLEAAPDAVVISDEHGKIVRVNGQAERMFGHLREELIGNEVELLLPERLRDGHRMQRAGYASHPSTRPMGKGMNLTGLRKNGSEFPVEISLSPIPDHQGILIACVIRDVTERKRVEVALEKKNERLHLLWETAGMLLSASDPDTMLHGLLTKVGPHMGLDTYLNFMVDDSGDALKLVSSEGVPEESVHTKERVEFGQSICGTVALLRQPIVANNIQQSDDVNARLVKSLGLRAYVCNPLISDNVLLGTLSFGSRSKDEFDSDEMAFLQTITHYVTVVYAKLRTQAAVRESEGRLRFILESIPQKLVTTRPDGSVDYFNPQWMEYTGLTFEQIQDWGWTQFIHPDDLDEHVQSWLRATKAGEVYEYESRFRRADGEYRWHVSRGVPMRDEAGQIIMWMGANTDIHDIKLAEMALMDSEIRYRRLFETAKDGILLLDTESGRITDANPFMSELLGYSHDHFLGKELWEIGLFGDKAANEAAVRTLQSTGYIRYEHLPLETNTGQKVEVEVVANAYHEDHHNVIQCNIRDITERSRLETERNRMEIQMQEQAVALEDLHRRKDEFLAMLSHELRNPLSPIASALQLLGLQKNEDQLQQKARTIIERQVGQLTRLIDDLLEVSRITTGRIHLQQERVAVNGIVEHAVETVRPLIVRHQHALSVSLSKEPIWVFADAARLEQVVVNLLTNAAKFTLDSGHIWLGVQQVGDECVVRVRDDGIGIAPETLPHIFDLFTQAEKSLDRSQGGLGIGLALVRRIVEMHKGRVEAISTLGAGTEFVVYLPVMKATENQPPRLENEDVRKNDHSLRVMVVDDNEDAAQMLGMLLIRSGHEVLTVHDGPSTLTAAQDFRPSIILLDIGLPGMDGFEVARKLRKQAIFKEVVLVAMTGYGQDSDRQRSKAAGFNHHLVKPPDFNKLVQILSTVSAKIF